MWGDTIAVAGDGSYRITEEGDLALFGGVLEMFTRAMVDVPEDVDLAILRIGYSIFVATTQGEPPLIGTAVVVKVAYWDLELYDTGVL